MNIINLTQHFATETQVKDGVFEPSDKNTIKNLLTFSTIPSKEDMVERAKKLAQIALESKADHAMVGGAAYFIPSLMTGQFKKLVFLNTLDSLCYHHHIKVVSPFI